MRLPLRKQRYASAVVPIREGFLYRKQNQRIAIVMYPKNTKIYWSLVRGRTSSIHSELIPTTAKQQLPFHLPFLELTYMRVPIAVSFANEMRLDLIQPNHKSVPFFTSFLGTPDLIMIEAHSPTLLSHLYPTTKGVSGLVITFRILTTKTRITNH